MKVAVIIPTFGRRELISHTVGRLRLQTRMPDAVIVSAPDKSHAEPICHPDMPVEYVYGAVGSVAQRNAALDRIVDRYDIALFLDDDFLPANDYLERMVDGFERNADWVVLTGHVLRDGISSEGISLEEGEAILAASGACPLEIGEARRWHAGYGCNMAVRISTIASERFDERLVLYGWQEDVDFTRRVARHGNIIRHTSLRGVHLGVKNGRTSGVRFGYSQIVNPIYLLRKGSVTLAMAAGLMGRNIAANLAKSVRPEPWIDRRGRLRGNLIAGYHVLRGRVEPEYVLEL
ncbi:MAG: glycosyltransferase family 2 protein [Hyphomicrobiaceae bacterium]